MHRNHVNKARAAKTFNRATTKTKRVNVAPPPMRGGIRL